MRDAPCLSIQLDSPYRVLSAKVYSAAIAEIPGSVTFWHEMPAALGSSCIGKTSHRRLAVLASESQVEGFVGHRSGGPCKICTGGQPAMNPECMQGDG